jgi:thiamine pyrophosphate-dependent acetolactate synthase large subunit-like protein
MNFSIPLPASFLISAASTTESWLVKKYAESYGAKGSRVTKCSDLIPTLEAAFKGGGVHLVVVPVDYSENKRVLVDELRAKVKPAEEPAE